MILINLLNFKNVGNLNLIDLQALYETLRDLKKVAPECPITLADAVTAVLRDSGSNDLNSNDLNAILELLDACYPVRDMYIINADALQKELNFWAWRLNQTGGNVSPYHIQETLEHYFPQIIFTSEEASDDRGILVDIYTPCQKIYLRASRAHGSSIWNTYLTF